MRHIMLKRLVYPCTGWCTTVVLAKKKEEPPCDKRGILVRARDLPIYAEDEPKKLCPKPEGGGPALLVQSISCARKELWCLVKCYNKILNELEDDYYKYKEEAKKYIRELRKEEKLNERLGVILGGALIGVALSLKRKWRVTKVVYALAGATAVASLIYPEEAKDIGLQVYAVFRECFSVIYHFLTDRGEPIRDEKEEKMIAEEQAFVFDSSIVSLVPVQLVNAILPNMKVFPSQEPHQEWDNNNDDPSNDHRDEFTTLSVEPQLVMAPPPPMDFHDGEDLEL